MFQIGKQKRKKVLQVKGFSLIEIIVSLALFSFIISSVVTVSLQMAATQKRIQAKLFLAQTAQTILESMSRQLRYGYSYSGNNSGTYATNFEILVNTSDISTTDFSSASSTQQLFNVKNSPYIIFESQNGNPNSFADQNAFCVKEGKLYKVSNFTKDTLSPNVFKAFCDSGAQMIPDSIIVEGISFDIYGDESENPKNPTARLKIKLKHEEGGEMEVQTTVTQRLVTYF